MTRKKIIPSNPFESMTLAQLTAARKEHIEALKAIDQLFDQANKERLEMAGHFVSNAVPAQDVNQLQYFGQGVGVPYNSNMSPVSAFPPSNLNFEQTRQSTFPAQPDQGEDSFEVLARPMDPTESEITSNLLGREVAPLADQAEAFGIQLPFITPVVSTSVSTFDVGEQITSTEEDLQKQIESRIKTIKKEHHIAPADLEE